MTGLLLALAASAISAPAQPSCVDVPQGKVSTAVSRLMTPDDLARLRDFGEPTDSQSDVGLSVSPDGRQVAFQIRQADPFSNSYPLLSTNDQPFWANMSVSRNAAKISTPILFNLADAEYLHSLVSIRALRFFGQPVDAYVFPDEQHIKWQAAHRLAVYERNIAWFDFWLKNIAPQDPETAKRWTLLRNGKSVAENKTG